MPLGISNDHRHPSLPRISRSPTLQTKKQKGKPQAQEMFAGLKVNFSLKGGMFGSVIEC